MCLIAPIHSDRTQQSCCVYVKVAATFSIAASDAFVALASVVQPDKRTHLCINMMQYTSLTPLAPCHCLNNDK